MEFECPRCHYKCIKKQHLIYHLNKKTPCEPIHCCKTAAEIIQDLDKSKYDTKEHKCHICDKAFSHLSSLYRHKKEHKDTSNVVINNITDNSTINTSNSNNIDNSHHTTNNTTNTNSYNTINNTTNNNNIHIDNLNVTFNILPFGKEDTKHIEEDTVFLEKCMKDVLGQGIPDIVEKIFFNEELPQNQNVKFNSLTPPQSMMVYVQNDDNNPPKWEKRELHQTLDQMIDKGYRILVKYKDQLFCITDKELMDLRNDRFSKVKTKKKGVYGPIKNGVLIKAKEAKEAAKENKTT